MTSASAKSPRSWNSLGRVAVTGGSPSCSAPSSPARTLPRPPRLHLANELFAEPREEPIERVDADHQASRTAENASEAGAHRQGLDQDRHGVPSRRHATAGRDYMEGAEDRVVGEAWQQVPRGLKRPESDASPKVGPMDPAAERAADAAVPIEEEDVFVPDHEARQPSSVRSA